ncbi:hypothetical protein QFZ64_005859 [Streptomyces sp. B3I8]|nr:hypothetical protein [Streptomyces sp. B3I8]MDQ0790362.1 hypothetical protein [Streptomyces sp. B3I8]
MMLPAGFQQHGDLLRERALIRPFLSLSEEGSAQQVSGKAALCVAGLLVGGALQPDVELPVFGDPVTQVGPAANQRVVDEFRRRLPRGLADGCGGATGGDDPVAGERRDGVVEGAVGVGAGTSRVGGQGAQACEGNSPAGGRDAAGLVGGPHQCGEDPAGGGLLVHGQLAEGVVAQVREAARDLAHLLVGLVGEAAVVVPAQPQLAQSQLQRWEQRDRCLPCHRVDVQDVVDDPVREVGRERQTDGGGRPRDDLLQVAAVQRLGNVAQSGQGDGHQVGGEGAEGTVEVIAHDQEHGHGGMGPAQLHELVDGSQTPVLGVCLRRLGRLGEEFLELVDDQEQMVVVRLTVEAGPRRARKAIGHRAGQSGVLQLGEEVLAGAGTQRQPAVTAWNIPLGQGRQHARVDQ